MARETRQNLIAVVIGLALCALIAAFFIRPAVVLPVGAKTLERSIGEPDDSSAGGRQGSDPRCDEAGAGFTCVIATPGASSSTIDRKRYAVEVSGSGCWQARARDGRGPSGCINLTDYFGY